VIYTHLVLLVAFGLRCFLLLLLLWLLLFIVLTLTWFLFLSVERRERSVSELQAEAVLSQDCINIPVSSFSVRKIEGERGDISYE